jgi:hypothetical protein
MEHIIKPSDNPRDLLEDVQLDPINTSLSGPMPNDLISSSSLRLPGDESDEFLIGWIKEFCLKKLLASQA